jgi:hypothetical protein
MVRYFFLFLVISLFSLFSTCRFAFDMLTRIAPGGKESLSVRLSCVFRCIECDVSKSV